MEDEHFLRLRCLHKNMLITYYTCIGNEKRVCKQGDWYVGPEASVKTRIEMFRWRDPKNYFPSDYRILE
jgi:hypothetical protein